MSTYKIILLSITLTAISLFSANAQGKGSFDIGVDYGMNSLYKQGYQTLRYKSFFSGSGLQVFTLSNGVLNVSCKYAIADKWHLGVDFAHEKIFFEQAPDVFYIYGGVKQINAYTIGTKINFTYIDYPFFKMYSGIAIAYSNLPIMRHNISAHLTGCGFRIGRKLAIQAEIGHGYRGKFNTGLNFQF